MSDPDQTTIKVEEFIELKKFDTPEDVSDEELDNLDPVEIIGIRNGKVVSHLVRQGDVLVETLDSNKPPKAPKPKNAPNAPNPRNPSSVPAPRKPKDPPSPKE